MVKRILFAYLISIVLFFPAVNIKAVEPLKVFHLDFNSVSLKKDYIEHWLKKAADMGYNSVLWEIEDEIKWETCPECASPDAFSKSEFKKILDYSKKLGLEPIPLLQTIGHAEYVLQHKKYFSFREDPERYDCYCTSSNEVKLFLKTWIKEYLNLFGEIKYFHLGGDEAYAFASCSKCKSTVEKIGENKFYTDYVSEISETLFEKGIRPGIWSDMILKNPKDINTISKEFVIWDWNYWDGDSSPENVMIWSEGRRIAKNDITKTMKYDFPQLTDDKGNLNPFYTSDFLDNLGFDVILCSSSRCYGDGVFAGRNDLHVDNIIGAARKSAKLNLLGNCVTSWAVRIHNFETQEPWLLLAPLTIKNPLLTKQELLQLASNQLFNHENIDFFHAAEQISYSFPFVNEKSTGIMWTGLKDSKPAPKGFIFSQIKNWQQSDRWKTICERISNSTDTITLGNLNLAKMITASDNGLVVLNDWSRAGYFQYWQSILANTIVSKTQEENSVNQSEIVLLINSLKNEYINWAKTWMTEESAKVNAGLIYDSIAEFFNQNY